MKIKNAKRIISIMLAFALTLVFAISIVHIVEKNKTKNNPNVEVSAFSGAGTEDNPYLIQSVNDLKTFFNNTSSYTTGYYKLTRDLDCSGVSFNNKLYGDSIFKGTFDGDGYIISNLEGFNCVAMSDGYPRGLFAAIRGATIKNLGLVNCSLTTDEKGSSGAESNACEVGVIVASADGGTIENCMVKNFTLKNTYTPNWNDWFDAKWKIAGIVASGTATIKNCYVEKLIYQRPNAGDKADQMQVVANYIARDAASATNCVIRVNGGVSHTAGTFTGTTSNIVSSNVTTDGFANLSAKDELGKEGSTWYYYSQYNDGWPALRIFIDWHAVFLDYNEYTQFSDSEIYIPTQKIIINGVSYTWSETDPYKSYTLTPNPDKAIFVYGQEVKATADNACTITNYTLKPDVTGRFVGSGSNTRYEYTFYGWKIEANYEMKTYTLTFSNATGTSGDTISPSGTSYTVQHGTTISASHTSGEGPFILTYTVTPPTGSSFSVTYSIPTKYRLTSAGTVSTITGATTITPSVAIKTYTVKIYATTDEKREIASWTVNYDDDITYTRSNNDLQWIFNHTQNSTNTTTYNAPANYVFNAVTIKKNGNATDALVFTNISGNIEIDLGFVRTYQITFKAISNTSQPTSDQTIDVKQGGSITQALSSDKKTLTYSYNGSSVTYIASQYYILKPDATVLSSINKDGIVVTPITEFYACKVTMGTINSSIGTISVSGDTYTEDESTTTDGIFVVEFGTSVEFKAEAITPGVFKYTYTFKNEENTTHTIVYTITDNKYAMASRLDEEDGRIWYSKLYADVGTTIENYNFYEFVGPTGEESPTPTMQGKTINPTFGLKSYNVELG